MKSHYKTEAAWMADFDAMLRERDRAGKPAPKRLPESEGRRPSAGKPAPYRDVHRPALPIERKWIRRGELAYSPLYTITRRSS